YPYLANLGFGLQFGYDGARLLMEKRDRPTALVCGNDELCMGALSYLKTHSIAVPDEVSIVCHGDIRGHEILYVQPTTASFNLTAIGSRTGEILLDRIRSGNSINCREIRYMTTLVPGNSTRRLGQK
ncbi:MAG: substrate-binding domain-containing protein, partial [Planctomycetaceae bacterium]|nr:substrate-binding domain-containing protein [Planctomycetaceae bacterium]